MKRREFLNTAAALPILAALPRASGAARAPAPLRANGERVNAALAAFSSIGRTEGGINRVAYSDADLAGRAFTLDLFRRAGLAPRVDAAGNIVARVEGTGRSLAPLVIGSHVDSVTDGGNYDGPVGSFAAIEVARSLREQRVRLRHPLEVVVWQNEEGGTVGSKAAIGALAADALDRTARSGVTIREGIRRIGEVVKEQVALYGTLTGEFEAPRPAPSADVEPQEDARVVELRRRPGRGRRASGA